MARPRTKPAPAPRVMEKALAVLDLFDERAPEWTEGAIGATLGLATSTANRTVRALERAGYLARTPTGRYRLGLAALDLGRRANATFDLRLLARPTLEALAAETGETAVLGVPDPSGGLRCLDRVETLQRLRLSLEVGAVVPLHAGATSKALLAFLAPEAVERVLTGPLPPLAPGTITDADGLRVELADVRARGYATSREETNEGAWGVAAPILGRAGTALAVVAVIGPTARPGPTERHVDAVLRAASLLSSRTIRPR